MGKPQGVLSTVLSHLYSPDMSGGVVADLCAGLGTRVTPSHPCVHGPCRLVRWGQMTRSTSKQQQLDSRVHVQGWQWQLLRLAQRLPPVRAS